MNDGSSDAKAVGWDPKSPGTLLVPTTTKDGGNNNNNSSSSSNNNMVMNFVLSDNGTGCNTYESSAIMNLLDARDHYLEETKPKTGTSGGGMGPRAHRHRSLRKLSKDYRRALANCIGEWSNEIERREEEAEQQQQPEGSDERSKKQQQQQQQQQEEDVVALDLLRATYAVTQLSETFLLLPNKSQESNNNDDDGDDILQQVQLESYGGGYEELELWNLPGAVTADTVRYLRLHHLGDAGDLFDPSVLEDMDRLLQPDQQGYYGDDGETETETNEYWELVEAYMIRGCLEDAWALLSHHSIVRRFVEAEEQQQEMAMAQNDAGENSDLQWTGLNDYQAASLAEDREGFRALKSILLSAPLPGARNNDSDEGFDDDDDDEEEKASKNNNNNNDGNEDNPFEANEELIEGLPSSAYCLWEISSGAKSNKHSRKGDYPVSFEPNAAYQVHQYWKRAISMIPSLQRLRRRIPQLNKLLGLLGGNFRDIEFGSWQEELCSELLYKNPNIRLGDMSVRATALVQKYDNDYNNEGESGGGSNNAIDEIVLTIMRGNAGQVVKVMHEFGGGSGAALPAVMTSLLSELLGDANVLQNPSDTYNLDTELLIGAASSIRSSLATEGYHDLGTRLAARLLLPHIEVDSDLRITASLVDTLEHHSPKSDAEANNLLSLCRKLIERKNVRVLDGCVSICLARHLYYIRQGIPGGAVHWLLTGMELESLVLCGEGPTRSGDWQRALAFGVCYRRLVAYFMETSRSLLKMLLGEEKGASLFYERAKEMVAATKVEAPSSSSSNNNNNLTAYVPCVKLLENVLIIAGAIVERRENSVVADSIVSCLEERPNDEDDGVVTSLAQSLNWDLLRLATAILDTDDKSEELEEENNSSSNSGERPISSFDVRGMGILLSVFTVETKARELNENQQEKQDEAARDKENEEIQQTRLILGQGLKRAFVAENLMKKAAKNRRSKTASLGGGGGGAGINGSNFSKHSREEQERAVRVMLEY